jgi:hypothetical protein
MPYGAKMTTTRDAAKYDGHGRTPIRHVTYRSLGGLAANSHRRACIVILRLLALTAHHLGVGDRRRSRRCRRGWTKPRSERHRPRRSRGDEGTRCPGRDGADGRRSTKGEDSGCSLMEHDFGLVGRDLAAMSFYGTIMQAPTSTFPKTRTPQVCHLLLALGVLNPFPRIPPGRENKRAPATRPGYRKKTNLAIKSLKSIKRVKGLWGRKGRRWRRK